MTRQCLDLLHVGELPQDHLVMAETMCRHNFLGVFAEHQVTYLRASVDRVKRRQSVSIPEADVFVRGTTTGR